MMMLPASIVLGKHYDQTNKDQHQCPEGLTEVCSPFREEAPEVLPPSAHVIPKVLAPGSHHCAKVPAQHGNHPDENNYRSEDYSHNRARRGRSSQAWGL